MKMTKREYLKSRGWLPLGGAGSMWRSDDWHHLYLDEAVQIQLARDAKEERACIADAIANAASRHCKNDNVGETVDRVASAAIAAYRSRFTPEFVDPEFVDEDERPITIAAPILISEISSGVFEIIQTIAKKFKISKQNQLAGVAMALAMTARLHEAIEEDVLELVRSCVREANSLRCVLAWQGWTTADHGIINEKD